MTQKDKKFGKIIKANQKSYLFADIRNFLESLGFTAEKNGTTHYIFRRNPFPHITIVVKHNHVKQVYVKRAVKILKEYQIIK